LVPYDSDKCLLLYVLETLSALRAMIAQKDDKNKERAIYYINKTLLDYETRYTPIKNMYFVIIFSSKYLRHYMLGNTTYVIAQVDPLKYLMSKSYLSGRAVEWVMLLQEFDLVFITHKSIKGHVIENFIANHLGKETSIT